MSREKEFAKNTIVLFLGTFFTKIIQYFLLPVYTGILSTKEYGIVELFNTIIFLGIPIIGLQIDQGIFRFLISYRNKKNEEKKLISTAFFTVVITTIIFLLIFIILNNLIMFKYGWLLFLNLIIATYSSLFMQISRGLGSNKDYSITSIITSIGTIVFNVIFLIVVNLRVSGMLYGSMIGYLFGTIYLFIKLKLYNKISMSLFDKKYFIEVLKYSLPMIPNSISWWIFSSSDRFIVASFIGLSATGVLAVAYKFSNIAIIIYNVFNMSLTESISLHINDSDIEKYYTKLFNQVSSLFTIFGTLLSIFMPIIFSLLVNMNFNAARNLIPIAVLATIFQVFVGLLSTIYISKGNTKSIALTSIVAAVINIISDVLLIKYIGIYAAVVSTLISYVVLFIYRMVDINKKYFTVVINKNLLYNLLLCIISIIPIYYVDFGIPILLFIFITCILLLIINRNIISNIIYKLKNNGILLKHTKN